VVKKPPVCGDHIQDMTLTPQQKVNIDTKGATFSKAHHFGALKQPLVFGDVKMA